ncbi:Expansin-like B1 [Vitis vinifera]|uniref:Expansin-like B1 n=1 Tax=Vitis vinifera TaxID=29760 RepID=A0A438IUZ0_VITVI|nr:Expansin-like B1 [Vitis vinifera]
MALPPHSLLLLFASFFSCNRWPMLLHAAIVFTHSRAAYYPNSDELGTETGQCGYGSFGATINDGDVSAASDLYRDGVGCGACYQASLGRMAQTTDAAASLLALGVVDIEYRRVSCQLPSKNITIKIDENSNFPYYMAFVIWYQQGMKDITAVQLCETQNFVCKLLDRSYGSVWTTNSPPSGTLSLRMLFSGDDGDETWVVPINNIPENWKAADIYDTGVQVN